MGAFDKKKAFSIGGLLTGAGAVIAVLANILDIVQLFDKDDNVPEKPEKSVAVVETIEESAEVAEEIKVVEESDVEETIVEAENVEEVVEESAIVQEEVIEPETEPSIVYINDLQYMSCNNHVASQSNLTDNAGNTYRNGLIMYRNWGAGEGSADYDIQGKYTNFSGIIAVPSGNEDETRSAYFEVYGDGDLLYTSPVMTNASYPEIFNIDITDVELLTISYPESNDKCDMATIYDGFLS